MDPQVSPTAPGAILGLLGLLLAFIGGLITLVVVLEFDPEARHYLDHGQAAEGKVIDVRYTRNPEPLPWEPEVGTTLTIEYLHNGNIRRAQSRPVHGAQMEYLKQGATVHGFFLNEKPRHFIVRDAMPHAPRDVSDFLGPAIFWILGATCLVFGPEMLYMGTTGEPENEINQVPSVG